MQLFQDGQSLLLGAVFQNPLDNSAAIRVRGEHKHLKRKQKKETLFREGGVTSKLSNIVTTLAFAAFNNNSMN